MDRVQVFLALPSEVEYMVAMGLVTAYGNKKVHNVVLRLPLYVLQEKCGDLLDDGSGPVPLKRLLSLRNYAGQSYTHREHVGNTYVIAHNELPFARARLGKDEIEGLHRNTFYAVVRSCVEASGSMA